MNPNANKNPETTSDNAYQSIVEAVSRTMNLPTSIWVPDEDGKALRIKAAVGLSKQYVKDARLDLEEESVTGEAYSKGKITSVYDIPTDPRWRYKEYADEMGWKSALCVPIKVYGKVFGVISVYAYVNREFSESEKHLLENYASQLELTETMKKLVVFSENIDKLITREPKVVLDEIVKNACQFAGADAAVVYPFDPLREQFFDIENVSAYGLNKPLALKEKPRTKKGMAAFVMREGELVIENIEKEDPEMYNTSPFIQREAIAAFMGISLVVSGESLGVLYVDYRTPHKFSEDEKETIRLFSHQAAIALNNSRLFQKLNIRANALEKLHDVGVDLLSITVEPEELKKLLIRIAKNAREVLSADLVDLYQYNQLTDEFVLPPVRAGKRHDHLVPKIVHNDDYVYEIVRGKKEIFTTESQEEPTLAQFVDEERAKELGKRFVFREKIKSTAALPLMVDQEVLGVIFVNFRIPQSFSDQQRELIGVFANQAAIAIHNSRLFKEIQQRSDRLELVRQVAAAVSSANATNEILQLAVDGLAKVFKVKQSAVALFDQVGEFGIVEVEYLEQGYVSALGEKIPLKNNPQIDKILETKQPLIVDDVESDPIMKSTRDIMAKRKTKSIMVVPIIIDEEVVGTIGVDAVEQRRLFTKEEVELAQAIADQASAAIRNARLFQQVTNRVEALKSLYKVGLELVSFSEKPEDLRDVLYRIANSAYAILGADLIDLYQYFSSQNEFVVPPVQIGELYEPSIVKNDVLEDDILYQIIVLDEPRYSIDIVNDKVLTRPFSLDRVDKPAARYVVREKIKASAAIPLRVGKEKVGVMFANFRTPQSFSQQQKELLNLFANQAAIAIHNSRLYQDSLRRSERLELVREVAAAVSSSTEVNLILQLAVDGLARVFDVKQSAVALFDAANEYAVVRVEYLAPGCVSAIGGKIPIQDNPQIKKIIEVKEPLIIQNIETDPELTKLRDIIGDRNTLSMMIVPIIIDDKVVGTIGIDAVDQERLFTNEDAQLAQAIANQSAAAMRIAQQLNNRLNDYRALQDITEQMYQGDLDSVLNLIAKKAVELTGAKHGGVWLVNKTRTALEFGGLANRENYDQLPPHIPLHIDSENSFSKWVVLNRQSYLSGNVRGDENYKPWYEDSISELTVPIIFQDSVIGTINVESPFENDFSDENKRLLEAMAGQAAVVVQNSRLMERLGALDEIGIDLTSDIHKEKGEILELIFTKAQKLTGAQDMYIAMYDENTGEIDFPLFTQDGKREKLDSRKVDMEKRGMTEDIIFTRKPILHKTQEDAKKWYQQPGHQEFFGVLPKSWLGVPMIVGDRVLGVIALMDWKQEYSFDEKDLSVFSSMASQAAIALENATLYYDVIQKLEVLNEVVIELTSDIHKEKGEILELIFTQAQKLTGAQDMYIAMYDENTGEIDFPLLSKDGKREKLDSRKVDMEKRGMTEEIIFTRKPILHKTQEDAKKWYQQPKRQEFLGNVAKSWLGVPMIVGDRVLGVLAINDWEQEYSFDEKDLSVFSSMASQAAISLENARLFEEARGEVIAAKQLSTLGTAIAALQHRINNTFNIIIPNVDRLRSRVNLNDPTVVEILDIIERNARYTSKIISRIQEPLKEVEVTSININAIIDGVVQEKRKLWKAGVTVPFVNIEFEPDERIPVIRGPSGQIAEVFDNLLENAKKAMPKGGEIRILSDFRNGVIMIKVIDSGIGISQEKQERLFTKPVPSGEPGGGSGLGLWLSRLMLQSIGGDIMIENSTETGTVMLVKVPVGQGRMEVAL
jgi:GAF domain-containing protein